MIGKIEARVGIFVLGAIGVFVYMGFQIGSFRFDRGRYAEYPLFFKDVSGVTRKADVKIAGVKVGWVEEVSLVPNEDMQVEMRVMILKDYSLYSDAYAVIRQDGLLGPKYIEIIAGDPLLRKLQPGDPLSKPSTEPVSIDVLMQQFKQIATNVDEVTTTFKDVMGGAEGREQLQTIFDNIHTSVEKLASVGETLDRVILRNEEHLDSFLRMGTSFKESIDKVSNVFDRDFNRIATKFESSIGALEDASIQARDGLRSVSSVAEKIDEGKGLLGKLVNEDETYRDLKLAVEGFKNYLTQVDRMQIVFDAHFESMIRPAESELWEDSKGFFNMRIYPREDYFYLIQLASSAKGYADRSQVLWEYFDADGKPVDTVALQNRPLSSQLDLDDLTRLSLIMRHQKIKTKKSAFSFGFQFGKIFNNIAFRAGLFEGTGGVAVDVDIPFPTDKFRWVTSLELYDMVGLNRVREDRRPHAKWLNTMFIFRNIYTTFGADDFASKRNASVFFGAGIRFGDDDIKYFLSSLVGLGTGFVAQ